MADYPIFTNDDMNKLLCLLASQLDGVPDEQLPPAAVAAVRKLRQCTTVVKLDGTFLVQHGVYGVDLSA